MSRAFGVTISQVQLHAGGGRPWAKVQVSLLGDPKTLQVVAKHVNNHPAHKLSSYVQFVTDG